MAEDIEHHTSDNLLLADKSDMIQVVIVVVGTVHLARHDDHTLLPQNGVARLCRATPYHNISCGVVDSYPIALIHRLATQPSVGEQPFTSRSQTIRPSVHHHPVTSLELRLQRGTRHGVDGKDQRSEHQHNDKSHAKRYDELQRTAHGSVCCDFIATNH